MANSHTAMREIMCWFIKRAFDTFKLHTFRHLISSFFYTTTDSRINCMRKALKPEAISSTFVTPHFADR